MRGIFGLDEELSASAEILYSAVSLPENNSILRKRWIQESLDG